MVADLMPASSARLLIDNFGFETAPLAPAQVHAVEHEGPVLAFGAARAGMDFDEAIVLVGLAGEQCFELHPTDFFHQVFEACLRFGTHPFLAFGVGQFVELKRVGEAFIDIVIGRDQVFNPRPLAQGFLCFGLVVPQVRVFGLRV